MCLSLHFCTSSYNTTGPFPSDPLISPMRRSPMKWKICPNISLRFVLAAVCTPSRPALGKLCSIGWNSSRCVEIVQREMCLVCHMTFM